MNGVCSNMDPDLSVSRILGCVYHVGFEPFLADVI
jgi:hypothetical protein